MHSLMTTCSVGTVGSPEQGRLAQILDEYLQALERGEPVAPDELLARHPEVADRLRGYLSGLAIFHRAVAPPPPALPESGDRGSELRGQLGDFRLVREIGRGGMGIVYEAVQVSLGRRVALKILPASSAIDEKHITRFKNEAQAAAQIDHPHIVPVFAIGQESGIHYFAMQLIGGQALNQLLDKLRNEAQDEANSSGAIVGENSARFAIRPTATASHVRTIARMGIQIAEALHAAHEIGVVHRDVKPSNLLLDEKGKVWITDFGVARCKTSSSLTETGHAVGTMAYMSPEQAEGQQALVDQRTDIYSLGVTLYELATLHHPGEGTPDAATAFHFGRSNWRPPRAWNNSIPVDFENIVMKALAEGREERYATARELADDLQRFVEGRPILARRPSLSSRAAKWARRHQSAVAAGVGAMLLGIAGLLVSLIVITAERTERIKAYQSASANNARAEVHFRQARQMLDEFGPSVAQQLANGERSEGVRKELLAKMLRYYQEFAREAAEDPTLKSDVALTYSKIGYLSEQLGALPEAQQAYEGARAILERLTHSEPAPRQHLRNLALCCNNLGQLLLTRGDVKAARQQLERALAIQQRLVKEAPHSTEFRADLATTHSNIGLLLSQTGDKQQAAERYRAAMQIQEAILQKDPRDEMNRNNLAASYNNLSSIFLAAQPNVARTWVEKAMMLQLNLAKENPQKREYQSDLALSYNNVGAIHSRLSHWTDAVKCFQDAIAIQSRLVAFAPLMTAYRRDLAVSYNNLGMAQTSSAALAEAEASFTKALAMQRELVETNPQDVRLLSGLGGIYNNLGMVYQKRNQLSEACTAFHDAIEMQKQAQERAPDTAFVRESLSKHYYNYAETLRALDRPAEAASAVLARRQLWLDNPDKLMRIAEELAVTCKKLKPGRSRQRFIEETAATIQLAKEAGLKESPDLRQSPFDVLFGSAQDSRVTTAK
jgi:eukaryotic-like serine/threonine-protein kinase